jgi:hypothetical protein
MPQQVQALIRTFQAGGALSQYRRVRLSTGKLAYAGASDADGVGVLQIDALAANEYCPVLLANGYGTAIMIAAGVISQYAGVYAAANGKVAASGTVLVGITLTAAGADGDHIEVLMSPATTIATFARSTLTQDALQRYEIAPYDVRESDLTHLAASASAGKFGITAGTHGSASPVLVGEAASGNVKTDKCRFLFCLPPEYQAGETITLRLRAKVGTLLTVSATLDVECFKSDREAGIGSDICATAVQTLSATYANYDFTITPTGLAAGDLLDIEITGVANDTGGAVNDKIYIGGIGMLLDIQG